MIDSDVMWGRGWSGPGDFDWNDRQRRAESVAERHIRTNSPDFVQWLSGRISDEEMARYVAAFFDGDAFLNCRKQADAFREEFTEFILDCDPYSHRKIASELEREL